MSHQAVFGDTVVLEIDVCLLANNQVSGGT